MPARRASARPVRCGPPGWLPGRNLSEVAFPLGGLGTGTVSLGGRGNLRDWEIFNSPGKGNEIGPAFFAVWYKPDGGKADARVLEREFIAPFMDRATYQGGHGVRRILLPGLPRFRRARFRGRYPFAELELTDPACPLAVRLEAFNPMIPLNEDDSGIPAAVFNWTFTNRSTRPVALSLAAALRSPVGFKRSEEGNRQEYGQGNLNRFVRDDRQGLSGLMMSATKIAATDPAFGTVALATSGRPLHAQTHWHRGGSWWDQAHLFWDDFAHDGRVAPVTDASVAPDGRSEVGDLVLPGRLAAGESVTMTVVLAWHFPNRLRRAHWWTLPESDATVLTNWYATRWADAWDVARYTLTNMDRLAGESRAYRDALFASTLPDFVLDAVSSQASIPRTATCLRLADGSFHGFEGCNDASGCCPMNCTHVWNYAQSMAFLFPALERSVRRTDFLRNTRKADRPGLMAFRTILPTAPSQVGCGCGGGEKLPEPASRFDPACGLFEMLPAADGQMGTIMRAYREWRISGDRDWLAAIWPDIIRALDYAWLGDDSAGRNAWDPEQTGVLTGQQHNTYDIEFFGPNPLMSVLYLGALRAGQELARAMGEDERADLYGRIYASGRKWVDQHLWRRDYYVQRVKVPAGHRLPDDLRAPDGSPKYQFATGCLSDQLLGQFLAHVCGLGHLLDRRKVAKAMDAIFRHNFRRRIGDHANVQRVYAVGDEAGLLLCTWPHGGREQIPFPYCDEVWTGVEYQVAAGLIYEGLVEKGLQVVRAARARYAGSNRNPFNEVECGHHYARAMSSWAVLLALSGFQYDASAEAMAFEPRIRRDRFRTFYSTGSSWGLFEQQAGRGVARLIATLRVDYGCQTLRTLTLSPPPGRKARGRAPAVRADVRRGREHTGVTVAAKVSPGPAAGQYRIAFQPAVQIERGGRVVVRLA